MNTDEKHLKYIHIYTPTPPQKYIHRYANEVCVHARVHLAVYNKDNTSGKIGIYPTNARVLQKTD